LRNKFSADIYMQLSNFSFIRRILFVLFFLSGFSSLVYQVVWTRMAFASFGIITPVLSVVLSVFMLGLAVGSWAGGRFIASLVKKTGASAILFYAGAEFLIGLGAFTVPKLFAVGESLLLATGESNSFGYLFLSALFLGISILPWCVFMGATFPLMMAYVRERDAKSTESFSYLYLGNVLGAMSGAFLTAIVFVEIFGFQQTLHVAAAGNFIIAIISGWLAWQQYNSGTVLSPKLVTPVVSSGTVRSSGISSRLVKWILFSTGFSAMALEVVWTRAFTPVLKTQVYSFALIVFTYLGATAFGSFTYRRHLRSGSAYSTAQLLAFLAIAVFIPVLTNDFGFFNRISSGNYFGNRACAVLILASICPFCAILGYLTPSLIDEYAAGRPRDAGWAYAVNVVGCILGPLLASYILLPWFSERYASILLGVPFVLFCFFTAKSLTPWWRLITGFAAGTVVIWSLFFTVDFESLMLKSKTDTRVRRDYAASVISFGKDRRKALLVNGVGMTSLTPITKFMVHLPLAFHRGKPESALVICFGMGTTYRSALSWDIDTTTVELVPSVTKAFGFYHADATQILSNPKGVSSLMMAGDT
jgi:spermidine synthase